MNHVKTITFTIVLLSIISIVNLYNAKYLNIIYKYYYIKQLIFYILGLIISILLKKLNLKILFKHSKYLYIFNILLLLLVLVYGQNINGSKAWFDFGFFSFQPSELMKYSLCIFLIEESYRNENKYKNILRLFIYTLIPTVLVFLEPDTGAIIFFIIPFLILLFSKKIKWHFYLTSIILIITFTLLFTYFYIYNQDILIKLFGTSIFYRIERIIDFKTNNYQLDLSLISIFSSNIIRNGFNNIWIYIPEATTDFILAFIIGNYGLIMLPLILFLYFILIKNILKLSKKANKKTNYLIISFIFIIFIQTIINVSMNIGLIPIIGINLPFLSYGGSNLIVNFIFIGTITSMVYKEDNL